MFFVTFENGKIPQLLPNIPIMLTLFRELLNNILCWNFETIYRSYEPSRNRVVVLARQAFKPVGNVFLESILWLLKC